MCLSLFERFLQSLCRLVGLTLGVDRDLSLALIRRSYDLGVIWISVVGVWTLLFRIEADVDSARHSFRIRDSIDLDGLSGGVVCLLLFGELDSLPLAQRLDASVAQYPVVGVLFGWCITLLLLFLLLRLGLLLSEAAWTGTNSAFCSAALT